MKVFVLIGEHFSQTPIITKVFASEQGARVEAASLVNIMLKDSEEEPAATPADFEQHLERLQDWHGAAHCTVEIIERPVED